MVELNPDTGMPVVPDGYFWRVFSKWEEYRDVPTIVVQLRKTRRFGSAKVDSLQRLAGQGDGDDENSYDELPTYRYKYVRKYATPEGVVECVRAMAELIMVAQSIVLRRAIEYTALKTALDTVTGEYPPKKLEAN